MTDGKSITSVSQPQRALRAEDVGDLVRVADHRRRPARHHDARELRRQQLRRLQVHVRVDEPGHERTVRGVDPLAAVEGADARDPPVGDRDVAGDPLPREGGEHARAADDEVRLGFAPRDREQALPHAASLASVPASTRTPRSRSSEAVNSSAWWLMPPALGTKTIPIGTRAPRIMASW